MKEAFIKYNLDKVIYSKSPSPTTQEGQRESPVQKMNTAGLNSSSDEVLIGSRKAQTLQEAIYVKNQQLDESEDQMRKDQPRQ